jgi:hypothetical protein
LILLFETGHNKWGRRIDQIRRPHTPLSAARELCIPSIPQLFLRTPKGPKRPLTESQQKGIRVVSKFGIWISQSGDYAASRDPRKDTYLPAGPVKRFAKFPNCENPRFHPIATNEIL